MSNETVAAVPSGVSFAARSANATQLGAEVVAEVPASERDSNSFRLKLPDAPPDPAQVALNVSEGGNGFLLKDLLVYDGVAFIHVAYKASLGRPPDEEGLRVYSTMLQAGASKVEILGRLRYSPEGRRSRIRIGGLAVAFTFDTISRLPVIGWFVGICAALWSFPGRERTLHRTLNEVARRLAQSEEHLAAISGALRTLEDAHNSIVGRLDPFAGRLGPQTAQSSRPASQRSSHASPTLTETPPNSAGLVLLTERAFSKSAPELLPAITEAVQAIADRYGPRLAVEFAYSYILGRRADPLGLTTKCNALSAKRDSIKGICAEMLACDEYRSRNIVQHRDPSLAVTSWTTLYEP